MACVDPMLATRLGDGSVRIVGSVRSGFFKPGEFALPCGQCQACRLERSRQWAVRCMHEAAMYSQNCFLTLTYDDASLPVGGTLVRGDQQLFMKRLRKRIAPERVRFFACGEYGESRGRPHYHFLLFGYDFPDKVEVGKRAGLPVFSSQAVAELWPHGLHELGAVSFESAAYVARYVAKKMDERELGDRLPEFAGMSLRPAIGDPWLEKYHGEVYPLDRVVSRGREVRPPRRYDVWLKREDPQLAEELSYARALERLPDWKNPELVYGRLVANEVVLSARLNLFKRELA